MLTGVSWYGHQLKVPVDYARVRVKAYFWQQGSVLAGTLQAGCAGFEMELGIKSSASTEEIARLVGIAENGCFVMQTLMNPTPVKHTVSLNGEQLIVGRD